MKHDLPETTEIEREKAWRTAGFLMVRWGMTDEDSCLCGSIRRLEPIVGDIDILAPRPPIPKIDPMHDLIARDMITVPEWEALPDTDLPDGKLGIVTSGLTPGFGRVRCMIKGSTGAWVKVEINRYTQKLNEAGKVVQSNRGWLQMIRTGPADWSKNMMIRWKALTNGGTSQGGVPITPLGMEYFPATEADAFALLRLDYCPPAHRASARFKLDPRPDEKYTNPPRFEEHGTQSTQGARHDRNGHSRSRSGGSDQKPSVRAPDREGSKVASPLFDS